MSRYYCWYSNRARGDLTKRLLKKATVDQTVTNESVDILDVAEHQTKKIQSRTWRECIKKAWEIDPLEFSMCGAEIKIFSFINEAPVIRETLEHLQLWKTGTPRQAAT